MNRLGKIGEGSYGIVYSASFKNKEKVYAVKRNFKESTSSWIGNIHEADILARLKGHPFVVELHQIIFGYPFEEKEVKSPISKDKKGMVEDKIHFIMEYIKKSGDEYIQSDNFNYYYSKIILCQILLSLEYMHSKNIIHRDLKPANVLIDYSDGQPVSKICDFGMSCNYSKNIPGTPGVVTCWYRAPEICFGVKDYGFKSDVWSFGCLLFEFFARKPWISGISDDDNKILNAIIGKLEEAPSDEDINYLKNKATNKIYLRLNDVINKRLSFESQMRFTTKHKEEFEKQCGSYDDYIDLLKKCLEFNPEKRISLSDILEHPFFKPYSTFISDIRAYKNIPEDDKVIIINNSKERYWVLTEAFNLYNSRHKYRWYKNCILFHAIDLFDKYVSWVMQFGKNKVKLFETETDDNGLIHTREQSIICFWTCLYIMHKYYSTMSHPKKWSSFFPDNLINDETEKFAEKYEQTVLSHVCKYRLFTKTLFEMIEVNKQVYDDRHITKLLDYYGRIQNYIGTVENLYSMFLKN